MRNFRECDNFSVKPWDFVLNVCDIFLRLCINSCFKLNMQNYDEWNSLPIYYLYFVFLLKCLKDVTLNKYFHILWLYEYVQFREILYICKILIWFILTIQGFLITLKTVETFDVMCTFNVVKCKKKSRISNRKKWGLSLNQIIQIGKL